MYNRSLFIFRQDLRLQDNTGLIEAMKNSESILPIFIHDDRAIRDFGERDVRFGFIKEMLEFIDEGLRPYGGMLMVYSGKPEDVVDSLVEKYNIDAIFCNRSYSPKGKERDNSILEICKNYRIDFHSFQDFLLVEPHECEQRKVFTLYKR